MLMKHFFLSSIKEQFRIPIVIELRGLNEFNGSLIEYIHQVIFNNKLSPTERILERLLTSGNFIFLLDGYDEIYSNRKFKITSELEDFIDKYHTNNYIITSRPGSGIETFPRFSNYLVQPLNSQEVNEFIHLQLKENEDSKLAEKIIEVISRPENFDYRNFLSSPLLLSMFILTFNSYPELPKRKSKFYWNVFDTLATKHDTFTKKGGYQHERKTGLQNEEFEKILKWFSYISLFEGKYSFDDQYLVTKLNDIKSKLGLSCNTEKLIQDLTLAIAIIIIDGIEYRFPHKSLQEYFCASLIQEQSIESKERIYTNKLQLQIAKSYGGNENFWNLCFELDKVYFCKFFLIKQLELIYLQFSKQSPEQLITYLLEITHLQDNFKIEGGNVILTGYGLTPNPTFHILQFVNINIPYMLTPRSIDPIHLPTLFDFLIKNKRQGKTNNVHQDPYYTVIYSEIPSDELLKFFHQVNHIQKFYLIVKMIRNKIDELNSDIIQEDQNKVSLLDLD
jgi:hypothetical protein